MHEVRSRDDAYRMVRGKEGPALKLLAGVLGLGSALSACSPPKSAEANSADAARACLDLIRHDTGEQGLELEDPNHATLPSSTRVGFEVVGRPTQTFYECRFTFDYESQTYTVHDYEETDRLSR